MLPSQDNISLSTNPLNSIQTGLILICNNGHSRRSLTNLPSIHHLLGAQLQDHLLYAFHIRSQLLGLSVISIHIYSSFLRLSFCINFSLSVFPCFHVSSVSILISLNKYNTQTIFCQKNLLHFQQKRTHLSYYFYMIGTQNDSYTKRKRFSFMFHSENPSLLGGLSVYCSNFLFLLSLL